MTGNARISVPALPSTNQATPISQGQSASSASAHDYPIQSSLARSFKMKAEIEKNKNRVMKKIKPKPVQSYFSEPLFKIQPIHTRAENKKESLPLNFATASVSTYHSHLSAHDSSPSSRSIGDQIKARHHGTATCIMADCCQCQNRKSNSEAIVHITSFFKKLTS